MKNWPGHAREPTRACYVSGATGPSVSPPHSRSACNLPLMLSFKAM
jgi:hypothetical protein